MAAQEHTSLFVLTKENPFRFWCLRVMMSPYFDSIVYICILASSVVLALDAPALDPDRCFLRPLNRFPEQKRQGRYEAW